MKRKLVQQGAGTLMASLPASWIKRNNLAKGDEIDIQDVENDLIIGADVKAKERKTSINLTSLTETAIRTLVTNAYRAGYDTVEVYFTDPVQMKLLNQVIATRLLGFDIVKRNEKMCVIQNITEPAEDQFDTILRKIFYNIELLFDAAQNIIDNKQNVEDIKEVEARIQRYDNFCRRVIAKKKLYEPNAEFLWTFMTLLIHAQRELYMMLMFVEERKVTSCSTAKQLLNQANEVFDLIKSAFLKKSIEPLERVHELEKLAIYNEGYKLLEKSEQPVMVYHILGCVRKLYLASSPLIGYSLLRSES